MGCQQTVLLISSDHVGWREVRAILATMPEVQIVGDTADVSAARRLAVVHNPAVIIAAATLDGQSILPLLSDLHSTCCPASKTLLFAPHYRPGPVRAPDGMGVAGYLLWSDLSSAVLRHALALLINGDVILGSQAIVAAFLANLRGEGSARLAQVGITERERALLGRLAAGQTREEIASTQHMSIRTVKRTIANLEQKLDAPNLFLLGMRATQLGIIR